MKICFFGELNPQYSRYANLIRGLRILGHQIIICRYNFQSQITNPFKFFIETIKEYVFLLSVLIKIKFNYLIVGYPILKPVWLTYFLNKKKIILDPFISNYNTIIFDHKLFKPQSIIAKLLYIYERKALSRCKYILSDTKAHAVFFSKFFRIPIDKFKVIPVGSNNQIYFPNPSKNTKKEGKFIVGFYGKFIPLQGIETIVQAAEKLRDYENISFEIIGGLQGNKILASIKTYIQEKKLTNVHLIPRVSEEELRNYIQHSTIQLGIFGNSLKAQIVIPNKVYSALAMAKAVITSKTYATSEFFQDNIDIILCNRHDPSDLAKKIEYLFLNQDKVEIIGKNAYKKYLELFTPVKIGLTFEREVLFDLTNKSE
ncbi:MAG: glycosyltransferase [Candidatus Lokiarchaeota archaeon]|nr:glycosyltransferase [Candidatus Harpocratesius repetitus]